MKDVFNTDDIKETFDSDLKARKLDSDGSSDEYEDEDDYEGESDEDAPKFEFDITITKGLPSRDGSPRRMLISCSIHKGSWNIERFGVDDGKVMRGSTYRCTYIYLYVYII